MSATITPQAFIAKWQQAMLRERASSQEHFLDLCRLLGHPTYLNVVGGDGLLRAVIACC